IDEQKVPELAPSVIRSCARALGRAAHWLIPPAVAATAGAAMERLYPGGPELAYFGWASLKRIAEDLSKLIAEMLIGNPSPAPELANLDEPAWTEIDPLDVHIAALLDQISAFNRFSGTAGTAPSEKFRQMLSEMHRHLNRLEELIIDNDLETTDFRD